MCGCSKRVSESIAPLYHYKNAYSQGDVAMRDGVRLVALVDIPAGTPYDKTMWKSESLQEAISDVGGKVTLKLVDPDALVYEFHGVELESD